jgi:hypothetical protein
MKNFLARLVFVLLSTTAMVFFSEKAYWYVQGYEIGGLILYYAFPVYACLWALDTFRVRRLSGVVLIGALFAFLVEGVLTPVIYEAGLLDPVMPAYFIGWHGLLSVILGWYLLRKWLVNGQWARVLAVGTLFGLFWGTWALTFWTPESIAEFEQLAAVGEPAIPGAWPVGDFALHAFTFAGMLLLAHWLLGYGLWQTSFQTGKTEKWGITLVLVALFGLIVLPVLPFAMFKLAIMLGILYLVLRKNRDHEPDGSLLDELAGPVKITHALSILAMPAGATLVYALAVFVQPSVEVLQGLLVGIPPFQSLTGAGVFLWALGTTLRPRRKPILAEAV